MTHTNLHYHFNVIIHDRIWKVGLLINTRMQVQGTKIVYLLQVLRYINAIQRKYYSRSQNKSPGITNPVYALVFGAILSEKPHILLCSDFFCGTGFLDVQSLNVYSDLTFNASVGIHPKNKIK